MMAGIFLSLQQFTAEFILGMEETSFFGMANERVNGIQAMQNPALNPLIIWQYENNAQLVGWLSQGDDFGCMLLKADLMA